jgi:hypothetical protein
MKFLLLLLFMILIDGEAHASVAKVFSFSSKINGSKNLYSCTATLIKYKGQCQLLTNNHCVENKSDFKISSLKMKINANSRQRIEYANQYSTNENINSLPVTLKNANHRLDLAVLNFDNQNEGLSQECDAIDEVSSDDYFRDIFSHLVKVFVVTGIVNEAPMLKFTSDLPWDQGYGATQVFSDYDLGDHLYFSYVSDLDIVPGMSGSPVVNNEGVLVGLATKYVDLQSTALIIPLPMMLGVLTGEIKDLPEVDLGNFKNNSMNDAGNEHGGAGNEHGGAGSSGASLNKTTILEFRAPDEGILINNEIVLGFTSKDGPFSKTYYHQIDGRDEFQTKVNKKNYLSSLELTGKIGSFISRPVNGYPDIKVREKLLERMDGFYYLEERLEFASKPFNQKHAFYYVNPKNPEALASTEKATSVLMIDVDSKKNKISIESEKLNVSFDVTYSADNKQIFLSNDKLKLTCDNRHLLKLICSNSAVEFSLSVNNTSMRRVLKYRLAYNDQLFGVMGFTYWFGSVSPTDDPAGWRKRK